MRELRGEGSGAGVGVPAGEDPCATLLGWFLAPSGLGDVFSTEKTQQTQPCEPGEQSKEPQHICGVHEVCWEGFGEAQEGAGSVEHGVGDEQLSWHGSVGVSLGFDAALSVTVPPTCDLAQQRGVFPRDHGQRRALDRAVGHVGPGALPS